MNSTAEPIPFGRSMLREHRHVCAFFSSAVEEYDALLPFICDGINCGQRAYHVLPSEHKEDHLSWLRAAGIDREKTMKSSQLEVAPLESTYLRTGRFDMDDMIVVIQEALKAGAELGFPLTRMIAHAETVVDDWTSGNKWVEYEMRLNEVLPSYDDPVICTYDTNLLTTPLAVDILRTHPMVVTGGVLIENSFFSSPQDFIREVQLRTDQPSLIGHSPTKLQAHVCRRPAERQLSKSSPVRRDKHTSDRRGATSRLGQQRTSKARPILVQRRSH
ncbi:MEDS domain-containing protein [Bradyrhizobium sp. USDA 4471]